MLCVNSWRKLAGKAEGTFVDSDAELIFASFFLHRSEEGDPWPQHRYCLC